MEAKEALRYYARQVEGFRAQGIYKEERVLTGAQNGRIDTESAAGVINMCANNYLGLSNNPRIIAAARASYRQWGYGLSSVRFICGTQALHKRLEASLCDFLGTEDAILYSSCFDANAGLFETLLSEEDAVISDALNHASIIDGIRLCRAKRWRYANNRMEDLERCLKEAEGARIKLVATDGVFSMDGTVANLAGICALAEKYGALVMVDDSHAVGFMGENGRGTPEYRGVLGRVDILTGTLGKALGGACGGYTAARREIVELLRQRSRPYLFSNALPPAVTAAGIEAIDIIKESGGARRRLAENTAAFRLGIGELGFEVIKSEHPICAIMLYEAPLAVKMSALLLQLGVYVVGFSYPVVPQGKARIRVQLSAAHSKADIAAALAAFARAKKELAPA